ncbi:MAG: 4Fe-4S binding protein [Dehalococcoidia bacterium]|nr:4Fe-4S binding protein [Dehalococcoidia bacterium]
MSEEVYRQMREAMAKRGGMPALDIPEFYEVCRVLFTPEEAEINNAMPSDFVAPSVIAEKAGKSEEEVSTILEAMADKGLCVSTVREGTHLYRRERLEPGIFEALFMRGTKTDRDRNVARAIHDYRVAVEAAGGGIDNIPYPISRVIPVGRTVKADQVVHTYDQVVAYIEKAEPISVGTCYCRQEALLLDENDVCGAPMEVCFTFNWLAEYFIERGIGRRVTKEEALEIFRRAEDAGLVHATSNAQELIALCNCCPCHCMRLKPVLKQPEPAQAIIHGFEPSFDAGLCTLCGICVDRCPAKALSLGEGDVPHRNVDRCIGCGACASGCPTDAITMVERAGTPVPPADENALVGEILKSFTL